LYPSSFSPRVVDPTHTLAGLIEPVDEIVLRRVRQIDDERVYSGHAAVLGADLHPDGATEDGVILDTPACDPVPAEVSGPW
jgi:hypothetical protein